MRLRPVSYTHLDVYKRQDRDSVFDLDWAGQIRYGDLFQRAEWEHSAYSFEQADTGLLFQLFDLYEAEAERTLKTGLVLPAYDLSLIHI